ncbi:MAG: hypothetical protein IPM48_01965 [Saprospiraceae bacterium]|nr:hypothetical protein [Saprospiraceae bacterium]
MRYLLGPELFWGILYIGAIWIGKLNLTTTKPLDQFIESLWFWIPAASVLVFGLWWIPNVEKSYLLLRVWICGLLGGHWVIEKALLAYSQQGPGIGMGYLAGLMLEIFVLMVGTIFVWIKF